MKQKRMFVVIISALVIMISLTYQGTYSYFTSRVEGTGNTENNQSQGQTNTLQNLIISESANVVSSNMIPGDSVTYTFTVQNPNNIDVCYNLLWNNTTNTFVNQKDLRVKLEKSDGTVLVGNAQFPATTSGTTMLLEGTRIQASTTDTFTLTVTYQNTEEDQTADMGKSFSGTIIGELGECKVPTGAETILAKGETDELKFDGTADNNLRYVGANPNNYVSFNNELWRIIGVFNNIDDGTGNRETRLEIIRDESYSEAMAWDTNNVNDWATASLQEELNGTYLNSIQNSYQEMISIAKWSSGGRGDYASVTAGDFYERERLSMQTGKIGLMYPSDYGYATSGGSNIDRNTCLNAYLFDWNNYDDCYNNNWLYDNIHAQWTLNTLSRYDGLAVFYVSSNGEVNASYPNSECAVSPALYLSSNVKISGGDGSQGNPYQLSL